MLVMPRLRYFLQQIMVIVIMTSVAMDTNAMIMYNHILSEHFGMPQCSMDFSVVPRLFSTKHQGPNSDPPGFLYKDIGKVMNLFILIRYRVYTSFF